MYDVFIVTHTIENGIWGHSIHVNYVCEGKLSWNQFNRRESRFKAILQKNS